jgi:hypothetical protein
MGLSVNTYDGNTMTIAANRPMYRHASPHTDVIVIRVGDPAFRGLRDSDHDLRRSLRRVASFCDPESRERARRLDRARLILLDALVERG